MLQHAADSPPVVEDHCGGQFHWPDRQTCASVHRIHHCHVRCGYGGQCIPNRNPCIGTLWQRAGLLSVPFGKVVVDIQKEGVIVCVYGWMRIALHDGEFVRSGPSRVYQALYA